MVLAVFMQAKESLRFAICNTPLAERQVVHVKVAMSSGFPPSSTPQVCLHLCNTTCLHPHDNYVHHANRNYKNHTEKDSTVGGWCSSVAYLKTSLSLSVSFHVLLLHTDRAGADRRRSAAQVRHRPPTHTAVAAGADG